MEQSISENAEGDCQSLSKSLSKEETAELGQLEATIQTGLRTFIATGRALATIHARKLYRATHSSFEHYAQERWEIARAQAYRLMESAAVADNLKLSPNGDIPSWVTEYSMRTLKRLKDPKLQQKAFKIARQREAKGTRITSIEVEAIIAEIRPSNGKKPLSVKTEAEQFQLPLPDADGVRKSTEALPAETDGANNERRIVTSETPESDSGAETPADANDDASNADDSSPREQTSAHEVSLDESSAPSTELNVAPAAPAVSLSKGQRPFVLVNKTEFPLERWHDGEAFTEKCIRSHIETLSRVTEDGRHDPSDTLVQQQLLISLSAEINRAIAGEANSTHLHRVEDVLDTLRRTVRTHPRYAA